MRLQKDIFEKKYCYELFSKFDILLGLVAVTIAFGLALIKGA